MKKTAIVFLTVFLLSSCSSMQIEDTATHKAIAYASGKAMAIGIVKLKPEADAKLTEQWIDLMRNNLNNELVPASDMIAFYNQSILTIFNIYSDPYGLLGDLAALLTIYGAQLDDDGKTMLGIEPVPYAILEFFEMGYANGRTVARKE